MRWHHILAVKQYRWRAGKWPSRRPVCRVNYAVRRKAVMLLGCPVTGLHGALLGLQWNDMAAASGQRGYEGVRRRDHVGAWFSTTPLRRATAAGDFCSPMVGLHLAVVGVTGRSVVAEKHWLLLRRLDASVGVRSRRKRECRGLGNSLKRDELIARKLSRRATRWLAGYQWTLSDD